MEAPCLGTRKKELQVQIAACSHPEWHQESIGCCQTLLGFVHEPRIGRRESSLAVLSSKTAKRPMQQLAQHDDRRSLKQFWAGKLLAVATSRQEADLEEKQKLVDQTCEEREKAINMFSLMCHGKRVLDGSRESCKATLAKVCRLFEPR